MPLVYDFRKRRAIKKRGKRKQNEHNEHGEQKKLVEA